MLHHAEKSQPDRPEDIEEQAVSQESKNALLSEQAMRVANDCHAGGAP